VRIVVLDVTLPGRHHDDVDDDALGWLDGVLALSGHPIEGPKARIQPARSYSAGERRAKATRSPAARAEPSIFRPTNLVGPPCAMQRLALKNRLCSGIASGL
jgi:hypothetical protein